MRRLLAVALVAAAVCAVGLAWIVHQVLCEEGCAGRPWPLVAQLIVACCGFLLAIAAAAQTGRHGAHAARWLLRAVAATYVAWIVLLVLASA